MSKALGWWASVLDSLGVGSHSSLASRLVKGKRCPTTPEGQRVESLPGDIIFPVVNKENRASKCTQGLEEEAAVTSIISDMSASKVIPVCRGHSLQAYGSGGKMLWPFHPSH